MKKLKLSGFDLGMIIAAVVVALLGAAPGGICPANSRTRKPTYASAKADFDKYSTKGDIVVSSTDGKILAGQYRRAQDAARPAHPGQTLDRRKTSFGSIDKEDPVAWKHDLDDEVHAPH